MLSLPLTRASYKCFCGRVLCLCFKTEEIPGVCDGRDGMSRRLEEDETIKLGQGGSHQAGLK